MNYGHYNQASARTERVFRDGAVIKYDAVQLLLALLSADSSNAVMIDGLKKNMFYGTRIDHEKDLLPKIKEAQALFDIEKVGGGGLTKEAGLKLGEKEMRVLHAVLGILSETSELVEALMKPILHGGEFDLTHIAEEIGDNKFYYAILYRVFGLDEDDIRAANVHKLQVRYPELFTQAAAENRDLAGEKAALEDKLTQREAPPVPQVKAPEVVNG